ncbi:TIGR02221 family CRISPR-associated protein [Deinococcus oregonensis]|uniref:TIGR02221 family CRISPR-associated protein n=1 Tax=Deinococcus oregonensis TaxID=1805970 RepID=A0ABV6AWT0_9DEIO
MIILSSLGTGAFREARYQLEGSAEIITTGYFAEAVQRWYPAANVVILATEAALASTNGQVLKERLPHAQTVDIPNAETEAEYWQIFERLAGVIPEGEEVIFDITHGLRSLPMLSFLALSYLKVVKKVVIRQVLYGALELTPRTEGAVTKAVDLTPLIRLLDWAQAANRFQDTGDARLFKPLIREQRNASLNGVADKLESLSQALFYNRTIEAGKLAGELAQKINVARTSEVEQQHRPFLQVLDQLEQSLKQIGFREHDDAVLSLQAQYAQIEWYRTRGHYAQAVALAREWAVSVRSWQATGHLSYEAAARKGAEDWLNAALRSPTQPPEWKPLLLLWDQLTDARNDLMHFGMRPDSARTRADKVELKIKTVLAKLPASVAPLGLNLQGA